MAKVQRVLMRAASSVSIRLYRASGGRVMGRVRGVPVLLLTVAVRKTGVPGTTAVSYIEDADRYVVTGSAGGAQSEPQWFRNLRRADHAVIEVGRQRMDVTVAVAESDQRQVLWERLLARAPFFAKYQDKVEREIPIGRPDKNSVTARTPGPDCGQSAEVPSVDSYPFARSLDRVARRFGASPL